MGDRVADIRGSVAGAWAGVGRILAVAGDIENQVEVAVENSVEVPVVVLVEIEQVVEAIHVPEMAQVHNREMAHLVKIQQELEEFPDLLHYR